MIAEKRLLIIQNAFWQMFLLKYLICLYIVGNQPPHFKQQFCSKYFGETKYTLMKKVRNKDK